MQCLLIVVERLSMNILQVNNTEQQVTVNDGLQNSYLLIPRGTKE